MSKKVIITGYAVLDAKTLEPVEPGAVIAVAPGDTLELHGWDKVPDSVPYRELYKVSTLTGRKHVVRKEEPQVDEKDQLLAELEELGVEGYDRRNSVETLREAVEEATE